MTLSFQEINDQAEREKYIINQATQLKKRRLEIFNTLFYNLDELVKLHVDNPGKAMQTANHLKSILYCLAELWLGERPKRIEKKEGRGNRYNK